MAMGWGEQVLAGLGFLGVGLFQAFNLLRSHSKFGGTPNVELRVGKLSLRTAEALIVAVLASLHILGNLLPKYKVHTDGNSSPGSAIRLERAAVAGVFLVYALAALISEARTRLLPPLPPSVLKLMAVGAFVEEFLLFYFKGRDAGLADQYHSLMLLPVGVCVASTALEIVFPDSLAPPLVRSMALVLQGTWLFQTAASLFSSWIVTGCELDERGAGDYGVVCEPVQMMHRGKAVATLQFNLQMAGLLVCALPAYALVHRVYGRPPGTTGYEPLVGEKEVPQEARELFELNDSHGGRSSFGDEEEEEQDVEDDEEEERRHVHVKSSGYQDKNGFHTVTI